MALSPINKAHALQIQAGTLGRKSGHLFEDTITSEINGLKFPYVPSATSLQHLNTGNPASLLLEYIAQRERFSIISQAYAISTGALATSEDGRKLLSINGKQVTRCKSDLVLTMEDGQGSQVTVGISTKQCNNKSPTNAQLYFTTARGFSNLLQQNGIPVTNLALDALRQFCGDHGFRPMDNSVAMAGRQLDPRRYFWEEIDPIGRLEWERLFQNRQDDISRLLFQKAYLNDPFAPDYIIHKTKKSASWVATEVAMYSVDELITLSKNYQGFATREYAVKKGSYKDPQGVKHLAPRFGVIQMQRGGQQQHPDQLQFNLEAGYFYKI